METESAIICEPSRYFDWAAAAIPNEEILKSALDESLKTFANPSSQHSAGKAARTALENAREECARVLGIKASRVFFTSGGTESSQIMLLSLLNKPEKGRIVLSAIEHPAISAQADAMKKLGFDVVKVNPDKNGFVNPDSIAEKINGETLLVALTAVNNETGCIQDIYETASKVEQVSAGKRKPLFHVDCVQAAGKIPLNLGFSGIDSAALSAHKISGPRGIGILYSAKEIVPFLRGGGQEQNVRSGTENLFGAIAFAKALRKYFIADTRAPENESANQARFEAQKKTTARFLESLLTIKNCRLVPKIRENLSAEVQSRFSPWIIQAAFTGIPGAVMVRALDEKGFCVSTGSACSSKKQSRPILEAMRESKEIQDSAVRFSFGTLTTEESVNSLFLAVKSVCERFCD